MSTLAEQLQPGSLDPLELTGIECQCGEYLYPVHFFGMTVGTHHIPPIKRHRFSGRLCEDVRPRNPGTNPVLCTQCDCGCIIPRTEWPGGIHHLNCRLPIAIKRLGLRDQGHGRMIAPNGDIWPAIDTGFRMRDVKLTLQSGRIV